MVVKQQPFITIVLSVVVCLRGLFALKRRAMVWFFIIIIIIFFNRENRHLRFDWLINQYPSASVCVLGDRGGCDVHTHKTKLCCWPTDVKVVLSSALIVIGVGGDSRQGSWMTARRCGEWERPCLEIMFSKMHTTFGSVLAVVFFLERLSVPSILTQRNTQSCRKCRLQDQFKKQTVRNVYSKKPTKFYCTTCTRRCSEIVAVFRAFRVQCSDIHFRAHWQQHC